MQVDAISFSAHADFPQTSEFLDALQPPHVVLVHGEATEMGRLKKALEQHAAALNIPRTLYMPKVTQAVLIEHHAECTAKVVGRLGQKAAAVGAGVRGLLVQSRGGGSTVMHHDDLPRFTKLHPGRVVQRQAMPLHRPFTEVRAGGQQGGVRCTWVVVGRPGMSLVPCPTLPCCVVCAYLCGLGPSCFHLCVREKREARLAVVCVAASCRCRCAWLWR
jgi:hypothetical protein